MVQEGASNSLFKGQTISVPEAERGLVPYVKRSALKDQMRKLRNSSEMVALIAGAMITSSNDAEDAKNR